MSARVCHRDSESIEVYRQLLVLLFCLEGMVWAQPQAPAPEVTIQGIFLSRHATRAIVAVPSMSLLVKSGDRLGDYTVAKIEAGSVTFTFHKQQFKIPMESGLAPGALSVPPSAERPTGPDDSIDLSLHGANLTYALKLLAKEMGQNICCATSVQGTVDLDVHSASLRGTLSALASSGGQQVRTSEGFLLVADAATLAQPEVKLPRRAGVVTLDFVGADLIYVLYILAKELNVSLIIGPEVGGLVTVTAKGVPTTQAVKLALWSQNRKLKATLDDHFLVVNGLIPPVTSSPGGPGPPLSVELGLLPGQGATKVADVVKKVAAMLHRKAVLPPNFQATVHLSLQRAPALASLERILALHGYRFRLEKAQLIVEPAT